MLDSRQLCDRRQDVHLEDRHIHKSPPIDARHLDDERDLQSWVIEMTRIVLVAVLAPLAAVISDDDDERVILEIPLLQVFNHLPYLSVHSSDFLEIVEVIGVMLHAVHIRPREPLREAHQLCLWQLSLVPGEVRVSHML